MVCCTLKCDVDNSCNGNCSVIVDCADSGTAGWAAAGGLIVGLVLGIAIGVACCIAVYKLVTWMKGKSLIFTPFPRIISPGTETTLHNPTYEIDNVSPSRNNSDPLNKMFAKKASQPPHASAKQHQQELYEVPEEPTNDAESKFDLEEPSLMPYAIHEFPEECIEQRTASINTMGPRVPSKTHFTRNKKGSKDPNFRRSLSESRHDDPRRMIKTAKPLIPMKPALKSSTSNPVPDGAYSELDKKTSYATLEPHMGDKKEDVPMGKKESYCHLNH